MRRLKETKISIYPSSRNIKQQGNLNSPTIERVGAAKTKSVYKGNINQEKMAKINKSTDNYIKQMEKKMRFNRKTQRLIYFKYLISHHRNFERFQKHRYTSRFLLHIPLILSMSRLHESQISEALIMLFIKGYPSLILSCYIFYAFLLIDYIFYPKKYMQRSSKELKTTDQTRTILNKNIIVSGFYYFYQVIIPPSCVFLSWMVIESRKRMLEAWPALSGSYVEVRGIDKEDFEYAYLLGIKNETVNQTVSSYIGYTVLGVHTLFLFFLSFISPMYFSKKMSFTDALNNYDKGYQRIVSTIQVIRALLMVLLGSSYSIIEFELGLAFFILILFIRTRPYVNFETRKVILWTLLYECCILGFDFYMKYQPGYINKNLAIFICLMLLPVTSRLSREIIVNLTQINFLDSAESIEVRLKGLIFYAEYFIRKYRLHSKPSKIDDKFLQKGIILEESLKMTDYEDDRDEFFTGVLGQLTSENTKGHLFHNEIRFERRPNLEFYFEGVFKQHYTSCKKVGCFCKAFKKFENRCDLKTEKIESQYQSELINKRDRDLKIFKCYQHVFKRKLLMLINLMFRESKFSPNIFGKIKNLLLIDVFDNMKPLCYITTMINKKTREENKSINFAELFFLESIKTIFMDFYLEDEGISDSLDSKKFYSNWIYLDMVNLITCNEVMQDIIKRTHLVSVKLVQLFANLQEPDDISSNLLHKFNCSIVEGNRGIRRSVACLFDENKYKGTYIFPFLCSYYLNSRGDYLEAQRLIKEYRKRLMKIPKLRDEREFSIENLSSVGAVLTVSLNLKEYGVVKMATTEAHHMFVRPEDLLRSGKSMLIGKNINSFFPRIFRGSHSKLMKSLGTLHRLTNKNRSFWIQREDKLLVAVSFMLKFSPFFLKGLSVMIALKEINHPNTMSLVLNSSGMICGYSYNWLKMFDCGDVDDQTDDSASADDINIGYIYMVKEHLSVVCDNLYKRLFEDNQKIKDNVFILERKRVTSKENGEIDKVDNIDDFALDQVKRLFDNRSFNVAMRNRLKKMIQFDESRGYLAEGIMYPVIKIPELIFRFRFVVDQGFSGTSSELGLNGRSYLFKCLISYRKDNIFGENVYFLECDIKSRSVLGENGQVLDGNLYNKTGALFSGQLISPVSSAEKMRAKEELTSSSETGSSEQCSVDIDQHLDRIKDRRRGRGVQGILRKSPQNLKPIRDAIKGNVVANVVESSFPGLKLSSNPLDHARFVEKDRRKAKFKTIQAAKKLKEKMASDFFRALMFFTARSRRPKQAKKNKKINKFFITTLNKTLGFDDQANNMEIPTLDKSSGQATSGVRDPLESIYNTSANSSNACESSEAREIDRRIKKKIQKNKHRRRNDFIDPRQVEFAVQLFNKPNDEKPKKRNSQISSRRSSEVMEKLKLKQKRRRSRRQSRVEINIINTSRGTGEARDFSLPAKIPENSTILSRRNQRNNRNKNLMTKPRSLDRKIPNLGQKKGGKDQNRLSHSGLSHFAKTNRRGSELAPGGVKSDRRRGSKMLSNATDESWQLDARHEPEEINELVQRTKPGKGVDRMKSLGGVGRREPKNRESSIGIMTPEGNGLSSLPRSQYMSPKKV